MPVQSFDTGKRDALRSPEKRLRLLVSILLLTIVVSTFGYRLIEGGRWIDALYMSVITIATVGFKEVYTLSDAGKLFTIFVITFSVVTLAYTVGTLGQLLVEGELLNIFGRRKMERQIKALKDHYIVIGYGRVGQMVYGEFYHQNIPCVVVENDPESMSQLQKTCHLYVEGNSIEDEVLLSAGVAQAKGLVCTIPNEADSVYIVLTARQLNPNIQIVARADSKVTEKKLMRAGANRVVLPYEIGGRRMAMACLQPSVVDFITMGFGGQLGLSIEEVEIPVGSNLAGQSLKNLDLRAKFGVTAVGVKKVNTEFEINPPGDTILGEKDILVLMGKTEQLEHLELVSRRAL